MLAILLGTLAPAKAVSPEPEAQALKVGDGERLLVVAPHPDDETLGAGGLVQRVLERGGSAWIALVTAGDGYVEAVVHETGLLRPRPSQYVAYGKRRLAEVRAALHILGRDRIRLEFLGFPDGGLDQLLTRHWQRRHPERSQTTGASDPPYTEAVEPDVPYDGADLRRELVRLLREAKPTIISLPDPLDRHPDHRAAGLFTLLALQDSAGGATQQPTAIPRLLAYLIHWPNWPPGWDARTPSPHASDAPLELPGDLPARSVPHTILTLTDAEVSAKRAALAQHATQQEEMASFLTAFVRHTEPFTLLPASNLDHIGRMIEKHPQPKRAPAAP